MCFFRYFWMLLLSSSFCMLFLCDNAPNTHQNENGRQKMLRVSMNRKGRQNGKYFYINEIISLVCFSFFPLQARCISGSARVCVCVRVNEHVLVLGCLSSASFPFFMNISRPLHLLLCSLKLSFWLFRSFRCACE